MTYPIIRVLKVLLWLALGAVPYLYALLCLWVLGEPTGSRFVAWQSITSGLTRGILNLVPSIAAVGQTLYPVETAERLAFFHYATLDLIWACVFGAATFVWWAPLMLRPGRFSPLYPDFLFRVKWRGRLTVVLGSILLLLFLVLIAAVGLISLFFEGDIYAAAHSYCARSSGWGRDSQCLAYAAYDLPHTVRKLGWIMSLVGAAIPIFGWGIPSSARYMAWAIRWKKPRFGPYS
jgi:hypothetical protein